MLLSFFSLRLQMNFSFLQLFLDSSFKDFFTHVFITFFLFLHIFINHKL